MKRYLLFFCIIFVTAQPVWGARAQLQSIASEPYISALLMNGQTGKILLSDNGSAKAYPASVIKLMDLLIIIEKIEQGVVRLDEMVQVTKEAAAMGGSQVYLDTREQFSVEDLLYALMVQSANDAAVALAIHVAGSKEAFVSLMNQKADELGMHNTTFHSVHGLPPSRGQKVDVTTAEDLALLALELVNRPEVFQFTNTREKDFRGGEFVLRTHNHLLKNVSGADGLKTGYFRAAGFSVVATAMRKGVRVIAIVLGSKDRKIRDKKSAELMEMGFSLIPPVLEPEKTAVKPEETVNASSKQNVAESLDAKTPRPEDGAGERTNEPKRDWLMFLYGLVTGMMLLGCIAFFLPVKKRSRKRYS